MPDNEPSDLLTRTADELGVAPRLLQEADLILEVLGTDGRPRLGLILDPAHGPEASVPIPDRFVVGDGPEIDLGALVAWLGLTETDTGRLPDRLDLDLHTDEDHGRRWEIDDHEAYALGLHSTVELPLRGDIPVRPAPSLPLPDVPSDTEPTLSGEETVGSVPLPEPGDIDAWPDDVDGWLAVIDRLRADTIGVLRAGDVRARFGGLDDEVLELTPEGPVDASGHLLSGDGTGDEIAIPERLRGPVEMEEGSWDPLTDPLDPALEEAMRIRGLPGALPPPEKLPAGPTRGDDADRADRSHLPLIPVDNRTAIVEEPEASAPGCLAPFATRRVLGGLGVGLLLLVVLFLVFGRDDGSGTGSAIERPDTETDDPVESAEEVLQRATQDLLDARTAEVEQIFTVDPGSGDRTEVSSTGAVDLGDAESQLAVNADGTMFDAHVTADRYSFDLGTGWVAADRGELADNAEAEQAGLGAFGIAEAMDPVGVAALLGAADDIKEAGDGHYTATVTLPVDSADGLVDAVYGRPQEELAGLTVPIDIEIAEDGTVSVTLTFVFAEATEFFADDPLFAELSSLVLTNETTFVDRGADITITGPDPGAIGLPALIEQLG